MKHMHERMKLIIARPHTSDSSREYSVVFSFTFIFWGLIRLSTQMAVAATGGKEMSSSFHLWWTTTAAVLHREVGLCGNNKGGYAR